MKTGLIVLQAALLAGVAVAQNSAELPSAPSATIQQRTFPGAKPQTAPPPAAPSQAAPAEPTQQPAPGAQPTAQQQPAAPATAADGLKAPEPEAPGQPPQPDPAPVNDDVPIETIVRTVSEVNLVFTATDKHGRFVKDLKRDDLKILDDNKPPASISSFASQTDLPLRVGLLVDASNSIRDRFRFEQEAAIEFLNQIVRHGADQAFVLGFDSTAEITQDFTDDQEKLSKGVRVLRPGGGTALFDAIYHACRDRLASVTSRKGPVRRAIIILSDGEDNQSRVTREEAIDMAQRAEVTIYAISTNISGVKTRGDKVLERFAETTGGRVFFPYKLQDVANAFHDIQDELRSQYAVSYKPADFVADGRFRPISIAANLKNVKVRTRKGYYAPKQ